MADFNREINFVIIHCCECGMPFGLTKDFRDRRKADGDWFFCPKGHEQHFSESEIKKLKNIIKMRDESLEGLRKLYHYHSEKADHELRRAAAYKGHLTRLRQKCGDTE